MAAYYRLFRGKLFRRNLFRKIALLDRLLAAAQIIPQSFGNPGFTGCLPVLFFRFLFAHAEYYGGDSMCVNQAGLALQHIFGTLPN